MNALSWPALSLIIVSLLFQGCTTLSGRVLEGAAYTEIEMNSAIGIESVNLQDQNDLAIDNTTILEMLHAQLSEHGFTIEEDSEYELEMQVYEALLKNSLKGERSITALLFLRINGELAARVIYSSEQTTGLESGTLLYKLTKAMVRELVQVIKNYDTT